MNHLKYASMLSLALLASGCATYSQIQSKAPRFSGLTAKSPESFLECAAPKILEIRGLARVIPDGASRVIVVTDATGLATMLTVTASPSGQGSHVALRQAGLISFNHEWNLAKLCL